VGNVLPARIEVHLNRFSLVGKEVVPAQVHHRRHPVNFHER
jgi:hypothetical protein